MTRPQPRTGPRRKADALAKLTTPELDGWVATAAPEGDAAAGAHLVPLSLAWIGGRVVIAVQPGSRTARNLMALGRARVGLGPTRDVVVIDAVLDDTIPVDEAPEAIAQGFADQADWEPRTAEGYVFLVLRPERIQAWREVDEIPGRTLMRAGTWLV